MCALRLGVLRELGCLYHVLAGLARYACACQLVLGKQIATEVGFRERDTAHGARRRCRLRENLVAARRTHQVAIGTLTNVAHQRQLRAHCALELL